jgi:hypothetical protein
MTEPVYLNPSGLLESYAVELLYARPIPPEDPGVRAAIAAALDRMAGGRLRLATASTRGGTPEATLVFVDQGDVRDAGEPPSWMLGAPESIQGNAAGDEAFHDVLHESLAQSWWWNDAAAQAHGAPHRLRLADRGFLTLDYHRRLVAFRTVLAAVLEATPCRAVVWLPSQQVVDPAEVLEAHRADPEAPLPGGLNVRFYRVDPRDAGAGDEELVMDTLGLGALGLIDLQCHFRGLDPEAVGEVLLRTGCYLFERGLVVRDGDSVQGPGPQDRWLARKTVALSPPEREILELDPGFPFAAGGEAG